MGPFKPSQQEISSILKSEMPTKIIVLQYSDSNCGFSNKKLHHRDFDFLENSHPIHLLSRMLIEFQEIKNGKYDGVSFNCIIHLRYLVV